MKVAPFPPPPADKSFFLAAFAPPNSCLRQSTPVEILSDLKNTSSLVNSRKSHPAKIFSLIITSLLPLNNPSFHQDNLNKMATAVLSRKTGVIVGDDVQKLFKYCHEKKFAIPAIVICLSRGMVKKFLTGS